MMEQVIQEKLKQIEAEHQVQVLYACESGSRAWGFASTDSDFDVRFIYAARQPDYLSIRDRRDVIELPVNEVLDISGWDLRKALQLFHKSNVPLYEWLQSPIVYRRQEVFQSDINAMMPSYFSPRAGCHHYLSMAINTFENDLRGPEVRLKRYFYALRPALACLWTLNHDVLPPMEFRLLRTLVEDESWQAAVDELLEQKQVSTEKTMVPPQPLLHAWLEDTLEHCKQRTAETSACKGDVAHLDHLFRKYILP